jgi:hypothetical protein
MEDQLLTIPNVMHSGAECRRLKKTPISGERESVLGYRSTR